MALAALMIAEGHSDQAIADALNRSDPDSSPLSFMSVNRHRHQHVLAPARALAEAADKGRTVATQRAHLMEAAEAGDPAAFLSLANIVADLRNVHDRLERQAEAAEQDSHRLAVSALSAQQLRAAETRAKLGGVGSFAPQKAGAGDAAGNVFSV